MKTIVRALVLTSIFAAPAVGADSSQSHHEPACMMTSEQKTAMHQHMQAMEDLMAEIKKQADPDKREAMIQKHMEEMDSGMQAMTMAGSEEKNHCKNMATLSMEERIGLMEERMDIIQLMMMQMFEQNVEQAKQYRHMHKR